MNDDHFALEFNDISVSEIPRIGSYSSPFGSSLFDVHHDLSWYRAYKAVTSDFKSSSASKIGKQEQLVAIEASFWGNAEMLNLSECYF
jgi:hypothetical protein